MSRKRRSFGASFKAKVALAACRGDKTTAQLASEYEVHAGQVTAWKKLLLSGAASLFEDRRGRKPDDVSADEQELYEQIGYAEGGDRAASEYLHSIGVKGIKYLDAMSRNGSNGSHNYVIFSGDDAAIMGAAFSRRADQTQGVFAEDVLKISLGHAGVLAGFAEAEEGFDANSRVLAEDGQLVRAEVRMDPGEAVALGDA